MTTIGTFTPLNLFAGLTMPQVTNVVTLEHNDGQDLVLLAGTVLAKKASGECVIIDDADPTTDEPYAVLAENTTVPTGTSIDAVAYLTGEFNEDALIFGGNDTKDIHRDAMRNKGMFLKKVIAA